MAIQISFGYLMFVGTYKKTGNRTHRQQCNGRTDSWKALKSLGVMECWLSPDFNNVVKRSWRRNSLSLSADRYLNLDIRKEKGEKRSGETVCGHSFPSFRL